MPVINKKADIFAVVPHTDSGSDVATVYPYDGPAIKLCFQDLEWNLTENKGETLKISVETRADDTIHTITGDKKSLREFATAIGVIIFD